MYKIVRPDPSAPGENPGLDTEFQLVISAGGKLRLQSRREGFGYWYSIFEIDKDSARLIGGLGPNSGVPISGSNNKLNMGVTLR